jgi:hypothetical protein
MSKAQRFFRYVWRANAILIFVAAAFAAFGIGTVLFSQLKWSSARRRANEAAPPVRGEGTDPRLTLGGFSLVEGTSVFRAKLFLHQYGEGLSSGGYSETRNIFFLDGSSGVGRWLLSGDTQVITYSEDLSTEGEGVIPRHPVATLVLAKPASGSL